VPNSTIYEYQDHYHKKVICDLISIWNVQTNKVWKYHAHFALYRLCTNPWMELSWKWDVLCMSL